MTKDQIQKLSCSYFNTKRCNSCTLLALNAEQIIIEKELIVKNLLTFISQDEEIKILSLTQPKVIFPSRAKAKLSVSGTLAEPIVGLVDKYFNGIELTKCPLHLPSINSILTSLPELIMKYKLTPYDIKNKTGELKGIIINANKISSEIMLRFILRSTECLARIRKSIVELQNTFPMLKVISANIQPIHNQILEGEVEHLLTNEEHIQEVYNGIKLYFSPQSFSQVTPEIAELLYLYVQGLVKDIKPDLLVDLYCGVGGFSLSSAKFSKVVIGIEYSKMAISSAEKAAVKNLITNCKFIQADSAGFSNLIEHKEVDLIIANPPRRGLDEVVIKEILALKPKNFIYSSCNPETLARDLKLLSSVYKIKSLAPFDMFPLTRHLEIVADLYLSPN